MKTTLQTELLIYSAMIGYTTNNDGVCIKHIYSLLSNIFSYSELEYKLSAMVDEGNLEYISGEGSYKKYIISQNKYQKLNNL